MDDFGEFLLENQVLIVLKSAKLEIVLQEVKQIVAGLVDKNGQCRVEITADESWVEVAA